MKIHKPNGHTVIQFKSKPYHFFKEREGIKKNTVRIVTPIEDEEIKQSNIDSIMIEDTQTDRSFSRKLSDITRYPYKDIIIYIFSWG